VLATYHIELRQFPHNFCRFNLDEQQLRSIVEPWSAGRPVELGERKWDPQRAKLTILDGRRIANTQLTMGRGWSVAKRQSKDVTGQVLAAVEERPSGAELATSDSPSAGNPADSLALEVLSSLADAPATLSEVWRLAADRSPGSSAAESLALAERALRSLLRSRLIILVPPGPAPPDPGAGPDGGLAPDRIEELLRAVDSWTGDGASSGLRIRRT
jgi:hypothetical protein